MPTNPLVFRVWNSVGCYYPGNLTEYWINRNGEVCACAFSDLYDEEYDVTSPGLIVERFTGLTDKNGKEIYENDIVRCHRLVSHREDNPRLIDGWYDCIEVGLIRWSKTFCGWVEDYSHIRYDDIHHLYDGTEHRYEIIGNARENPELLTP